LKVLTFDADEHSFMKSIAATTNMISGVADNIKGFRGREGGRMAKERTQMASLPALKSPMSRTSREQRSAAGGFICPLYKPRANLADALAGGAVVQGKDNLGNLVISSSPRRWTRVGPRMIWSLCGGARFSKKKLSDSCPSGAL
jgi:hypothetical protein